MLAMSRTVVVLPLVPATATTGMRAFVAGLEHHRDDGLAYRSPLP